MVDESYQLPALRQGMLCVVSGPSGCGKTTLCHRMTAEDAHAQYATSATTRTPRGGEVDGQDYHFFSREEFLAKVEAGEFLEYAEVHGNYYGTLKSEVFQRLDKGIDVLMDLDVQGVAALRVHEDEAVRAALVDIFIVLDSDETLISRLATRGTETDDQVQVRLRTARDEMKAWPQYSYTIVSEDRDRDFAHFQAIITAERQRTARMMG